MTTIQTITEKVQELGRLALNFVSQAASNLLGSASEKAGSLSLEEMNKRLDGALKALRGENESSAATVNNLELRKQAFLDTYSVKVLDGGPHQVSFTIREGKSRMDLINDARELARALYNHPGVHPNRLAIWRNDPQYTQVVTQDTPVAVEGCVPNSTNMTRDEHESKDRNWNDVDIRDLAAAQQAFFIATGKDHFDGNIVRARGGALSFDGRGLDVNDSGDDDRYIDVAASRSLPLPN